MNFSEDQQAKLFEYVDGNQMPSEEEIARILNIDDNHVIEAMVFLEYELCSDCGCWVESGDGDFIENDFVCQDCHD